MLLGSSVCSRFKVCYFVSPNRCATQQAIGKEGRKRFPLPNTYRTILNRHCELQDPIDARSLSILAQVGLHQMHILKASISFGVGQVHIPFSQGVKTTVALNGQALEEREGFWP